MFNRNIRILITFCVLLGLVAAQLKPLIHFGRCTVQREIGFCQHRSQCWERNVNFNSSSRSRCSSQVQSNLVCCRRAPTERYATPMRLTLPQPGVCGNYNDGLANRIVGGILSGIMEYPWMALLRYTADGEEYSHLCGGSLIHGRWVLTAAHCIPARDADQQLEQVRLGEWNTTSSPDCQIFKTDRVCAPVHVDIDVDRIIIHEQYAPSNNYANDIAMIRLERIVDFTEFILPICLPAASQSPEYAYAGYALEIAGWGNTEQRTYGGSPVKMKAELNAISIANCRDIYMQLVSGQMCAGGESTASTCRGDSGGPLMLLDDLGTGSSNYYVTGIVSLGSSSCNNGGRPMIFTRVEYFMPWIMGTMNSNS